MKSNLILLLIFFLSSCQEPKNNNNHVLTDSRSTIVYENIVINNSEAKSLFENGLKSIESNNYDEAYTYFTDANFLEPNNVIVLNGIANIESMQGKINDAEKNYEKSLSIDSSYVISYVNYGKLLNKKKFYEKAEKILRIGLSKSPSKAEKTNLYYNLVYTLVEVGECEKAKEFAILAEANSEFEDQKNKISKNDKGN
ncbi:MULTISPECIES: hypothetical protein [Chryseobacterium]|uniref:hypothetical protein n=1 Tax=Chryseobacterium TaxID=59732 RepID=UPI001CBC0EB8|nr:MULTISPECIES: hypothetical protein [Chryseobacterium]MDR6466295.1 tetratricopeptide (TPR) repeat protein [Chryseobacterium sediminis]